MNLKITQNSHFVIAYKMKIVHTNVTREAIGSLNCFNSNFDVKQLIEDSEYGVS
jgi:hypothetical protein